MSDNPAPSNLLATINSMHSKETLLNHACELEVVWGHLAMQRLHRTFEGDHGCENLNKLWLLQRSLESIGWVSKVGRTTWLAVQGYTGTA